MSSCSAAQYKRTEAIDCISSKLQRIFKAHKDFPLHYQTNKIHDCENLGTCLYYLSEYYKYLCRVIIDVSIVNAMKH